jgi:hypothetical protein
VRNAVVHVIRKSISVTHDVQNFHIKYGAIWI